MYAARELEKWELMARYAARVVQLTPARDRPFMESSLVLALHRCGRDQEALAVLRSALLTRTNYPDSEIPRDVSPAFLRSCYALATEIRPRNYALWLARGTGADDPAERAAALRAVIELSRDPKITEFNEAQAAQARAAAERLLEFDRIRTLDAAGALAALQTLSRAEGQTDSAEVWLRLAGAAAAQSRWEIAAEAGGRAIELTPAMERHRIAHHQILALHTLDRDKDALAVLHQTLRDMHYFERPQAIALIPFLTTPARTARQTAFLQACLALAAESLPGNVPILLALGREAPSAAARRAALQEVITTADDPDNRYVPASDDTPAYIERMTREYRELQDARAQAEALLRAG